MAILVSIEKKIQKTWHFYVEKHIIEMRIKFEQAR